MKTKLIILTFILSSGILFGQKKQIELADKLFDKYAYIEASKLYSKIYLEAINRGDTSTEVLLRLGDCYYNNSNAKEAVIWYDKAMNASVNFDSDHYYKYALALHSAGRTKDALVALNNFLGSDIILDSDTMMKYIDSISNNNNLGVDIENLELNTENSDFGSYVFNGKLYFASSRVRTDLDQKQYVWNEQPYLNIYEVLVNNNDGVKTYSPVRTISADQINTAAHEASVTITNDGQTMYFTRDNLNEKDELSYDEEGTSNLKLTRASLVDNQWVVTDADKNAFELVNGEGFSTGSPALSPDNKQLYFVSDADSTDTRYPDGMGKTDLYYLDIFEDNGKIIYGPPHNLGPKVNTNGREMFPHITKDLTLYFSSDGIYDGKIGLGLLDIYKTDLLNDENAIPVNLGNPYNSKKDDFAFFIEEQQDENATDRFGYFSSNRNHADAKGNDDIYSFKAYKCKQTAQGVVRDSVDMKPLDGAFVELFDESGKILDTITVNETGAYQFQVECGQNYTLRGSKLRYKADLKEFSTSLENNKINQVDLILAPIPCVIKTKPILFTFDKYNIRPDAREALKPVLDLLLANPDIRIMIESHTDTRGSDAYNVVLSDNRAKSTRDYLIDQGVDKGQIIFAIGYGEKSLCITDEDINNLPTREKREEAHQKNRRSRFVIENCNDDSSDCQD